jgi:superfamily II DNA/RNA helicase
MWQHGDMSAASKLAALNKFRNSNPVLRQPAATKVLVLYDVPVKTPDISHVPLVINYGILFSLLQLSLIDVRMRFTQGS